jgi:hypothetical protein
MLLASCVSGIKVEDLSYSLEEIRSAIKVVAVDFKSVDPLKRKYESIYFPKKPKKNFDPEKHSPRYYARFIIVGDRRPFTVVINVIEEVKEEGEWVEQGSDEELSQRLAQDLRKALAEGRVQRNAVDSFRAF